jgi:CRP-like cAMP-binding protein
MRDGNEREPRLGNALLDRFPPVLRAQITSRGEGVLLQHRQVLYVPDRPAHSVYFPVEGLVSLVMTLPDGEAIELATAGSEGMLGAYTLLTGETPFFEAVVQAPGRALRVATGWLRDTIGSSREAHGLLVNYASFLTRQMGQQAACNALHRIEQRCCRWLLAGSDRLGTDLLPLTHEYLALVLGVRRPGLTTILGRLQKAGLLRQHRGRIELADHAAIAARACGCYAAVRSQYDALAGAQDGRARVVVRS